MGPASLKHYKAAVPTSVAAECTEFDVHTKFCND